MDFQKWTQSQTILRAGVLFLMFLFFLPVSCTQELKSDNAQIEELISNFYLWYADQIELGNNLAFQPDFYKFSDTSSALDFKVVEENLKELGFHETYIVEYKNSFSECSDALKNIPMDSLMNFDGITEYEDINCDFFNSYYWTKDMEPHDGVEVVKIELINGDKAKAVAKIYNIAEKMRIFWEHKEIRFKLIKIGDSWKIDGVEVVIL